MVAQSEDTRAQVERILQSATFRNAEALRRLLRYLAEKSLSGEANDLKEYTVAVDALGKPSSYDPRQDSQVRIQLGRLRQKLAEYYRSEGKDDAIVIEFPKGHFILHAGLSSVVIATDDNPAATNEASAPGRPRRRLILAISAALLICLAWGIYSSIAFWTGRQNQANSIQWTSEMNDLWRPFLNSKRPLLVSVSAPLFIGLQGTGLFRDLSANTWEEALNSPKVAAVRQGLHNPQIVDRYYYIGFADTMAIFHLGKLLAAKDLHVSFVKSNDLSWQQLSDDNVILIGPPRQFAEQLSNLPTELELSLDETGVRFLHPDRTQPVSLDGAQPLSLLNHSIPGDDVPGRTQDGEVFALITFRPGPLGNGCVASFCSTRSAGSLGAVRWFTEPDTVRTLAAKLRRPSGELPRYFQLLLKVKYKDAVPTDVTYVMHRELSSVSLSRGTK